MNFSTPTAVLTSVDDGTLANILETVSKELPAFVSRLLANPGDLAEVDQMTDSIDAAMAVTQVCKVRAYADPDPASTDDALAGDLPPGGGIGADTAEVSWLIHDLADHLNAGKATRTHFDAALTSFADFRPILETLLSAHRNPESVQVSNL